MAKSYTYGSDVVCQYIFRNEGSSFSSNLASSSSFDIFTTGVAVDDYIVFGLNYNSSSINFYVWNDVKFDIGTAVTADVFTVVWQYWDGDSWETLSVTDGTNAFTTTGTVDVEFDPPSDWDNYCTDMNTPAGSAASGQLCLWVRCKVTAVTNITVSPAQSTTTVKINKRQISFSGGTDIDPVLISDIYAEDVSQGWGIVTKLNDYAYEIDAGLIQTGGYFEMKNVTVYFNDFSNYECSSTSAIFRVGDKISNSLVKNGANMFIKRCPLYGNENLAPRIKCGKLWYGLQYSNLEAVGLTGSARYFSLRLYSYVAGGGVEYVNCRFEGWDRVLPYDDGGGTEVYNCKIVSGGYYGLGTMPTVGEGIVIGNCYYAWLQFGTTGTLTLTDPTFDNTMVPIYSAYFYNMNGTFNMINPTGFDFTDIRWGSASSGTIYEKYRVNVNVVDEAGDPIQSAVVLMTDESDTTSFSTTTDANGDITEQSVTRRTHVMGATEYLTTTTDKFPFIISVYLDGYEKSSFNTDLNGNSSYTVKLLSLRAVTGGPLNAV